MKERARTKRPSGCPKCCTFRTSKIEQVFREALKSVLPDLRDDQNSYVLAGRKYQVDVLADWNGKQVAVEYDGELFHGTYYDPLKPAKDVKKTEDLLTAGFLVVRIREGKLPFVPVSHPHLLQVPFKHRRQQVPDASILDVVAQVETWLRSL